MDPDNLDQLRAMVFADSALQAFLWETREEDVFVARVIAAATERGLSIGEREVKEALACERRAWMMRWIQ